jgi:hypothetical protein
VSRSIPEDHVADYRSPTSLSDDRPDEARDTEATRETAVTDDTGTWQGVDHTVHHQRHTGVGE